MLMFVPDRYKDQNMCNKAVENYPYALTRSLPKSFQKQDLYAFK